MKLHFCDTTLRDGEQTPGVHFNRQHKIDIAKQIAKCGADTVEAGFPASSDGDFSAVQAVAQLSHDNRLYDATVSALARLTKPDIDRAAEALKPARHKRLHIFIATSDIHLEHKLHKIRAQILDEIFTITKYAKNLNQFDEIEFSPEDATRTNPSFLLQAVTLAAQAGASVINIPDTTGYTTPDEFKLLITSVKSHLKTQNLHPKISVHCHNDLGMAVANSLAAVAAGAEIVECTVNGLGERAGNAAFEEIVMAVHTRSEAIIPGTTVECSIKTGEIMETSRLVASLSGIPTAPNKAVVGRNAFAHSSGIHQHGVLNDSRTYEIMSPEDVGLKSSTIVLGKLSGRHAFAERLSMLGYSLDEHGIVNTFARFKEIADKKRTMTDDDIRAIVGEYLDAIEGRFYLESFQIQSGNHIKAMALVTLTDKWSKPNASASDPENHTSVTEAAPGEGPIDAAFNAINRIAGLTDVELSYYNITAVTEGTDALGEAKVKLKQNETTFSGRGVSTDVIKASIKAYLAAVNKLIISRKNVSRETL